MGSWTSSSFSDQHSLTFSISITDCWPSLHNSFVLSGRIKKKFTRKIDFNVKIIIYLKNILSTYETVNNWWLQVFRIVLSTDEMYTHNIQFPANYIFRYPKFLMRSIPLVQVLVSSICNSKLHTNGHVFCLEKHTFCENGAKMHTFYKNK